MSPEKKRKQYKCRKHTTLDQVPTWQELGTEEELELSTTQETHTYDKELNEKVSIWEGDITTLEIDIIVNAANKHLYGGGGVCGAIFSACSKYLEDECESLGGCVAGHAVMTGGYNMPAKYILHAVGPQDRDAEVLKSCYETCLGFLSDKKDNDLRTIAFPCISTGIYGFPNRKAAEIAVSVGRNFLEGNKDKVDRIIFCLFAPEDKKLYRHYMSSYFPLA